jgi:hypothetical protein
MKNNIYQSIIYLFVIFLLIYIFIFSIYYGTNITLYNRAKYNIPQEILIQNMLVYAVKNVKFYKDSLNGKQIILSNFPIVNKKFIRDNQESMISKYALNQRYIESTDSANNSWTEKKVIKKDITVYETLKMIYYIAIGGSIAQTTGGSSGEYFYQWFSMSDFWNGLYTFVKGWINIGWTPSDSIFLFYFHDISYYIVIDIL